MEKFSNDQWLVMVSIQLYKALLKMYPSEFRLEYGAPMLQLFKDCCRRSFEEAGAAGLLSLWRRTMLDTVRTAIEEHSQRGVDMSREKFIQLCGWGLMIGGPAVLLGWLAGSRPEYNRFNTLSLPIDRYINAVQFPLIILGLLLLCLGFLGLLLQYGQKAGVLGSSSLAFSMVSGLVSTAGAIGLGFSDSGPWWNLFFLGLTFLYLGLVVFGLANLRQRLLPRWNGLPAAAGIWLPLYMLMTVTLYLVTGSWVKTPEWVWPVLMWASMLGLTGIGYLLLSDARLTGRVAPAA
jgi:hypothetical protein